MNERIRITGPLGRLDIDDTRDLALLREILAIYSNLGSYAVRPKLYIRMDTMTIETVNDLPR